MLTYMSLEYDNAAKRAAKLKALQDYFHTSAGKPFAMLPENALAPSNRDRGDILVVNSHGNGSEFADYDASGFLEELLGKGLAPGSFKAIYLMACNVGEQAQDNSILNNFAKELKGLLKIEGIDVKLYAPRGTLSYWLVTETVDNQEYYRVTDMYIETPERNYPLEEGLLLAV